MNLLKNGKMIMLPKVLWLATLFSCSKQDLQDQSLQDDTNNVQVQQESLAAIATTIAPTESNTIIYEETFENGAPFTLYMKTQFAASHSFKVVDSPAFAGTHSGRFELRDTDPMNSGGTRAEIRFPSPSLSELNRWYSWSAYLPSSNYKFDKKDEVLNQWHQGSGYSPSISLRTREDKFWLFVKPTPTATDKIDLGMIPKDKWNTFVFHIIHSSGSDGLIELWINGVKVVNRAGANTYDLSRFETPRWNLGIYKSAWNGDKTTDATKRVVFYDNIRMGNKNATYNEMSSSKATAQVPLSHQLEIPPVNSITLVNASTEKDVLEISNGATISRSQLGASIFNLRANTDAPPGSIKFEMTGPVNHTYVDSKIPYALFGDDNNGNYFAGNLNPLPAGNYTIKVTPYYGQKATSLSGAVYSVDFKITP